MKRTVRLGPSLIIGGLLACGAILRSLARPTAGPVDAWPYYGHNAGGTRYSPLTQINRENVARLKLAWEFHTGDVADGRGFRGRRSGFETTPLVVDGKLYLTTPFNRVIALDPETGKQRWAYDRWSTSRSSTWSLLPADTRKSRKRHKAMRC
jgi:quinoprotein glucose dehydrogenase